MAESLPLMIPAAAFANYFDCPICLDVIKTSRICAPCGHHFCEKCITESVNLNHRCPCCNTAVAPDQLLRDHQYDAIAAKFVEEKGGAEARYFEGLVHSTFAASTGAHAPSPIELVFQKHMREGLAAYERLTRESKQRLATLRDKHRDSPAELRALEERMGHIEALVVSAYDEYLGSVFARPRVLPVQVTIVIPAKGISLRGFQVLPTDTGSDLRDRLLQRLLADKHDVVSIDPAVRFVVQQAMRVEGDISDCLVILPSTHPLLEFSIDPDSELHVEGAVVFREDLPRVCLSVSFDKDRVEPQDFYHCRDCAKNWICENCKDVCHKGHQVTGFMKQHKPTWACCYCPKTKRCCLQSPAGTSAAAAAALTAAPLRPHRADPWETVSFPGLDGSTGST